MTDPLLGPVREEMQIAQDEQTHLALLMNKRAVDRQIEAMIAETDRLRAQQTALDEQIKEVEHRRHGQQIGLAAAAAAAAREPKPE